MEDVTKDNFGYIISYIIPGFIGLWGLSLVNSMIASWLSGNPGNFIIVKDVFFIILASLGVGIFESAIRWIFFEIILNIFLKRPKHNFSKLKGKLGEFESIVENHYKYHQFYANSFIAVILFGLIYQHMYPGNISIQEISIYLIVLVILFASAIDALLKYDQRVGQLFKEE